MRQRKQIKSFVPKEYWNIIVEFEKGKKFFAKLTEYDGQKINVDNKKSADEVLEALKSGTYKVCRIIRKERKRKPFPPFTTSSLQQDAANKLGFTTKKTMMVAQQLYEGVEIKGQGTQGLVTYIRTDSVRISDEARASAKTYITEVFGSKYTQIMFFPIRKKTFRTAHEAISQQYRLDPEAIKESLTKEQYGLYKLIWTRFLASQMAEAVFDAVQVSIENGKYGLRANGSRLLFDGYQKGLCD